jgi:hypothetical protein
MGSDELRASHWEYCLPQRVVTGFEVGFQIVIKWQINEIKKRKGPNILLQSIESSICTKAIKVYRSGHDVILDHMHTFTTAKGPLVLAD